MERRRRALGLKKLQIKKEEETPKSKTKSAPSPTAVKASPQSVKETEQSPAGSRLRSESGQRTPQRTVSRTVAAPSLTRLFVSPEVEVTWDWGCSQEVSDKLAVRRSRRVSQSQAPPVPALPVAPLCPRLPLTQQISEQENQERLAFYKKILSQSITKKGENSSKNNNYIEKKDDSHSLPPDVGVRAPAPVDTTPKRIPKPSGESSREFQLISDLLDDSVNDFMLECSQAIEEQLMNGEIDGGPVVSINISSKRLPHSPLEDLEVASKKVCNGKTKQNLFPESPNLLMKNKDSNSAAKKRQLSLRSPRNNLMKTILNRSEISPLIETKGQSDDGVSPSSFQNKSTRYEEDDILFMRPTQPSKATGSVPCQANNINKEQRLSEKLGSGANKNSVMNNNNYTSNKTTCLTNAVHPSNLPGSRVERRPLQNKPVPPVVSNNTLVNGNQRLTRSNTNTPEYDCLDKFRRVKSGGCNTSRPNQNLPNNRVLSRPVNPDVPNTGSTGSDTVNSVPKANLLNDKNKDKVPSEPSKAENRVEGSKSYSTDITSLLDDGFDLDLCSLDFESLCCNSQPTKVEEPKPTPKVCTEQEIEEKRRAAQNRLMMKKKR